MADDNLLNERFNRIETRFDQLDGKAEGIERDITKLAEGQAELLAMFRDMRAELRVIGGEVAGMARSGLDLVDLARLIIERVERLEQRRGEG